MKIVRVVCGFCFLIAGILAVLPASPILAQDGSIPEEVKLVPTYPKLESSYPGINFGFDIRLEYQGSEPRPFDLSATGPLNWNTYITSKTDTSTKIGSIVLEPAKTYGQDIKVTTAPPAWFIPEPGEYKVTVAASAGDVKESFELTAVVTATYRLALAPAGNRYNTSVTAGKDNYFSVTIQNNGSGVIDNITLSSSKPEGWTIDFSPTKVDSLPATEFQTVDVNIKPPSKTISGDYSITLRASGTQTSADALTIRVTVETPTVWGWVGVGIIVLVIAGVAVIFMRFGRR